jgi:hypothetical protein
MHAYSIEQKISRFEHKRQIRADQGERQFEP